MTMDFAPLVYCRLPVRAMHYWGVCQLQCRDRNLADSKVWNGQNVNHTHQLPGAGVVALCGVVVKGLGSVQSKTTNAVN